MLKSIFEGISNLFSDEEKTNGSSSVPSWAPEISESPSRHAKQYQYQPQDSFVQQERSVTGPVVLDPSTAARVIAELEREVSEIRVQRSNLEDEVSDLRSRLSQIERMVKF